MSAEALIYYLQDRIQELKNIERRKKKALRYSPPGILRISNQRNALRFYCRANKNDKYGRYISAADKRDLPKRLAQKHYDQKVIDCLQIELRRLEKLLRHYQNGSIEQIIASIPPRERTLILALCDEDTQFLETWKSQDFIHLGFPEEGIPLYAKDGTRVRSKSEQNIANMIIDKGLPYIYEKPLTLETDKSDVYPDFTIYDIARHREIYWEHFGMMAKKEYVEENLVKLNRYNQHGITLGNNLILTMETKNVHFSIIAAERQLDNCLSPH